MLSSASRCPVHFTPDFILQVTTACGAQNGQMNYFTLAGRLHSSLHCRLRVWASAGAAAAALAGCTAFDAGQSNA
jgi:hypothetical protein